VAGGTMAVEGGGSKNGEADVIPLSSPTRTVLDELPRIGEFVFTSSGHLPISDWTRTKRDLDDLSGVSGWRIHDLRRTVATGLQKLKTPLQVTEAILGHTAGSRAGVIGIYQRHDYADEKRAALEAWGAHVLSLGEGRAPGRVFAVRGTL